MKKKQNNIGLENVKTPDNKCEDRHCPFHGKNKIRGSKFVGEVVKAKSQKSASVKWDLLFYIPKYERYEKRKTKIQVHNPPCINAKEGDIVLIGECKPISKTKNFVILEKK